MQDWIRSRSLQASRGFVIFFALLLLGLDVFGFGFVDWFSRLRQLLDRQSVGILITLYACSLPGWLCLWSLWQLLGRLQKGQVFTEENIRLLQRVSLCCAAAAGICVFGCFFYLPFLVAVAAASFMALIVRIVRNVFQTAMEMKSELDLTV